MPLIVELSETTSKPNLSDWVVNWHVAVIASIDKARSERGAYMLRIKVWKTIPGQMRWYAGCLLLKVKHEKNADYIVEMNLFYAVSRGMRSSTNHDVLRIRVFSLRSFGY